MAQRQVPVYISFDYDHDSNLKTMLAGQAKLGDSPFSIADWSIKVPSSDWKDKARARIRRVEQVIILCGLYAGSATGIDAEIGIARDEKKPYFLLAAPGGAKRPKASSASDTLYKWTWPNLKALIAGKR